MIRRVAAVWALIGFSVQCFLAAVTGASFVRSMPYALGHYLAWGCAGFLATWIGQRIVRDVAQTYALVQEELERTAFNERLAVIAESTQTAESALHEEDSSYPSARTVTSSGS